MSDAAEVKPEKKKEEQWMEVLDYAEKAGQENIKFHIENGDCIAKESNTTLTILLTGGAAALGYWMKLLELKGHPILSCGVASVSFYLFALAFGLLLFGMEAEDLEAPTNEPKNLSIRDYSLDAIREVELENLQERINKNVQRVNQKAKWLNWIRRAMIFTPLVFVLALAIGQLFIR